MKNKDATTRQKLFLIDGNGLAYRAFYAVTPMQTSTGIPVNAVAGFADMVLRLLRTEKPTHVAVAFDKGIPTERVDAYQDYNAQRVDMPADLAIQLPVIEDFVRALGVPVFRVPGHEADDCIGTIARMASEQDMDVLILSGDLGLLQLVDKRVRVLTTRRGISDMVIYDETQVKRRFNLLPRQLADLRALAGDSSDNITGVPGIGEVTAKKLLSQHGSLETLLKSLQALPAKWRNPLSENRDQALEFKSRASIRTDLELAIEWNKCLYHGVLADRVGEIFTRMELTQVLGEIPTNGSATPVDDPLETVQLVQGKKAKTELSRWAKRTEAPLSMLFLGAGADLVGVALAEGDERAIIVPIGEGRGKLPRKDAFKALEPALTNRDRKKYVHNLRAFLMLDEGRKVEPGTDFFDVGIASHLLDAREGNPWLDEVARRNGLDIPGEGELLGHGTGYRRLSDVPPEELADWAGRRVLALGTLGQKLERQLDECNLLTHYQQVELVMARVFADIESEGVHLDEAKLDSIVDVLSSHLTRLEQEIYDLAGGRFDIREPKELAEVLFDKMGLTVAARPKNGAAIGNDVLAQVATQSPIGDRIRDFRALEDLRTSYLQARPRLGRPRHGWFNRVAQFPVTTSERLLWMGPAAVGGAVATYNRLLSEIEGLPNEVMRRELSQTLLSALRTESKGRVLIGFSYDQFQLRLAAHLSGEQELLRGFSKNDDVESLVASLVQEPEQVSDEVRQDLIDSVLGSIGAHRLARRSGLTPEEAAGMISGYLSKFYGRFAEMQTYFDHELRKVRERGWVESISGRRRTLPEISSRNSDIRDTAERVARSAAIQSSAADVLKQALVAIRSEVQCGSLRGRLVMQLRDTLILEVEERDVTAVASAVERLMENVVKLDVPLRVKTTVGETWAQVRALEAEPAGRS